MRMKEREREMKETQNRTRDNNARAALLAVAATDRSRPVHKVAIGGIPRRLEPTAADGEPRLELVHVDTLDLSW